jgi:ubiquinone/menaquinone biosynthesis C-methylase UbiE
MIDIVETLNKNIKKLNLDYWFAQWEYMQNAYLPYRNERFEFIVNLSKHLFKNQNDLKILDIGCGLLSFSIKFLNYWKNIKIIGIDYHPILYYLAKQKYNNKNIELILFDIRNDDYNKINDNNFDLIISSTALHWLSKSNLTKVIEKSYNLLKENGYFINIDHMKNESDDIQQYVDNERNKIVEKELKNENIKNWNNYFNDFYTENNILNLKDKIDNKFGDWEGIEVGLTFNEFKNIMEKIGYKSIDSIWQYLNDRIIIGKK